MSKFIQTHFFHLSTFPLSTKQIGEKKKYLYPLTFLPLKPNEPLD